MPSPPHLELAQLAPDDAVITPSGREARVVSVFADIGEALVQWDDGQRARFRISRLRLPPKGR